MKSRTFLLLLVVTGVLAALAFFRFGGVDQKGAGPMGQELLADLPVNQVAKVEIIDAENEVTLVKGETVWQVEERNGYPADFDELRKLVVKLSKVKIGRTFAGTTDSIARLSLASPRKDGAKGKGKQIILQNESGDTLADVIVGETRKSEAGTGGGQYLKKSEADDVYLVDEGFPFLKASPPEWLKKEVLNIGSDDVASVTCYAGKERSPLYALSRPQKGETAQLNPVPEGRKENRSKIDQVFDALSPLTLEDVESADQMEDIDPTEQIRLVYRLYDGREVTVLPKASDGDSYTVRLRAKEVDPAIKVSQQDTPDAASEDETATSEEEPGEETEAESAENKKDIKSAVQLDEEMRPWIFTIKKWQYDSLITDPELLLEEKEKKDETS